MVIHKRTRLTPIQRQEIYQVYHGEGRKVSDLAEAYHVSRPTIYKILRRGRQRDFSIHKSTNKRFCCLKYGIKRLSKIEKEIESRLKSKARRYNKDYPGQMLHGDTKRLPLLKGESTFGRREYLFIAIDDFSRELYAAILPYKTQNSAKVFLEQVLDPVEKFRGADLGAVEEQRPLDEDHHRSQPEQNQQPHHRAALRKDTVAE